MPLALQSTRPELEYFLTDTGTSTVIVDASTAALVASIDAGHSRYEDLVGRPPTALPVIPLDRRAMILFTSGTTSKPKGVVTTHANIAAQITSLITAWEWTANDRIVLCLPLHHVHGIINVVSCALWSGAVCEMLPRFDAAVAAVVEHHLAPFGLPIPAGVNDPSRTLTAPWSATPGVADDEVPHAFRRHGVLLAASEMASV